MKFLKEISQIRKDSYERLYRLYPYVKKRKIYSYRRFKVNLCIGMGAFLIYLFFRLKIKANYITLLYVLSGIIAGVLLALPQRSAVFLALVIFYFRMVLDWTDGGVARLNNETSVNGAVFDAYSALFGWVPLWIGVGFYLARSTSAIFYYLTPIIPGLFALDLYSNARESLIYRNILRENKEDNPAVPAQDTTAIAQGVLRSIKDRIDFIFSHNTSTVDFILLLILIEMFWGLKILWVYYLGFLLWQAVIFTVRLILIMRGGWAESQVRQLRKILYE